jgi:hypothetical protein
MAKASGTNIAFMVMTKTGSARLQRGHTVNGWRRVVAGASYWAGYIGERAYLSCGVEDGVVDNAAVTEDGGRLESLSFMVLQSFANFSYMRAMNPNCFVQLLTSNSEFLGPVMDIGCHFRIDLVWVVRALFGRELPSFRKRFRV